MPNPNPDEPTPSDHQPIITAGASALAAAIAFAIGDFINGPRAGIPIAAAVFACGVGPRLVDWAHRSRQR